MKNTSSVILTLMSFKTVSFKLFLYHKLYSNILTAGYLWGKQ